MDAALPVELETDPTLAARDSAESLGERAYSKLRWRCRRGLLENDLFIEKFFARHEDQLTVGDARALYALMNLSDNDLMDLLMRRQPLPNDLATPEVSRVLALFTP
jgi:antitoxin CptB